MLFATSSFWQGVDVVGEALSCVIIDKLPFASPGDPITAARIEAIGARRRIAFGEYQVPLAILALQQGLGRLIRHRQDRGVLAVLDPRLRTMGYGRRFLASLPPAPMTHRLLDVARFFEADDDANRGSGRSCVDRAPTRRRSTCGRPCRTPPRTSSAAWTAAATARRNSCKLARLTGRKCYKY